ncbi:VOC family protein [Salipaludibacillus agaradhaerens]|jgi:lactoylglutathione lyase|uniref:VOC family protein n=1 Tax=Salipaludibacillus agaradhaerens TaxID=76935 RepID=UPI000998E7FC|nr:VOC family protein [Salipaludibacillus agaradhaerens]
MITGLAHIALTVENMDKSLSFYCDTLGLTHAFQVSDDNGEPWIEYVQVGPQQFIELFYGGKNKGPSVDQKIGVHHLCFRVDNVHRIAEHLTSQGIQLDVEPKRGKGGNDQCWVSDPDGNRIEFLKPDDDSPHLQLY